jgi:hypothetical protein
MVPVLGSAGASPSHPSTLSRLHLVGPLSRKDGLHGLALICPPRADHADWPRQASAIDAGRPVGLKIPKRFGIFRAGS